MMFDRMTIHEGPDRQGKHSFTLEWQCYGKRHAQVFCAALEHYRSQVKEIVDDRRRHDDIAKHIF